MRSFRLSQQQTLLGVEWTENHSRHSSLIQWSSLGNNELVSVKLCFFQEHFNPLTFPYVPLNSHLFQVGRSPVRCTVTLAFCYIAWMILFITDISTTGISHLSVIPWSRIAHQAFTWYFSNFLSTIYHYSLQSLPFSRCFLNQSNHLSYGVICPSTQGWGIGNYHQLGKSSCHWSQGRSSHDNDHGQIMPGLGEILTLMDDASIISILFRWHFTPTEIKCVYAVHTYFTCTSERFPSPRTFFDSSFRGIIAHSDFRVASQHRRS